MIADNLLPVNEDFLVGRPETGQRVDAQTERVLGTNMSIAPNYIRVVGLGQRVIEQGGLRHFLLQLGVGRELQRDNVRLV